MEIDARDYIDEEDRKDELEVDEIVDITTTYDLYHITGYEELLISRNETLSSLKEFVNNTFDWEDEFLTDGSTFFEVNERLQDIGYWAEESTSRREEI